MVGLKRFRLLGITVVVPFCLNYVEKHQYRTLCLPRKIHNPHKQTPFELPDSHGLGLELREYLPIDQKNELLHES